MTLDTLNPVFSLRNQTVSLGVHIFEFVGSNSFQRRTNMDNKVLQVIVALLIPPLAVYMKKNTIDNDFWINLVLTFLGGFPGVIHALWVILR